MVCRFSEHLLKRVVDSILFSDLSSKVGGENSSALCNSKQKGNGVKGVETWMGRFSRPFCNLSIK